MDTRRRASVELVGVHVVLLGRFRSVYCKGDIVLAVNTLEIYNDSKDFIDSPLKAEPGSRFSFDD